MASELSAEELKKRAEAKEKLEKSQYDLGTDHLCSAAELELTLRAELGAFVEENKGDALGVDAFEYKMLGEWRTDHSLGIPKAARDVLLFDAEGNIKLNKLTEAHKIPEWMKFLLQLSGFFSLLLWGGSILCFVGFGLRGDMDNLYLGIVLAAVVLVTGIFSYSQEAKSASLMAQFSSMMAPQIKCYTDESFKAKREGADPEWLRDNGEEFNPLYLVRGDLVKLTFGDKVPADVRILEADDFKIDNSALTGEPDALERGPKNSIKDEKEAKNMCFYGTDVKNGTCVGVVLRTGDDTYIGKIAQLTEETETEPTPINKEIHHFIKIVSGVALFLGGTFFAIGAGLGTDFITNLVFMIGIIVANVPEGLLATVTVCLTLTSKSMASKNVLVKNMEGVETLGSTTCICSDKTGTLTQNKMTFAELLFDNRIFRTEFVEPDPEGPYPSIVPSDPTFQLFHTAMCLNSTATFANGDLFDYDADKRLVTQEVGGRQVNRPAVPFYDKRSPTSIPAVNWRTQGDASESSIIKFAQYMYPTVWSPEMPCDVSEIDSRFHEDLMEVRRQEFPMAPGGQIPFNSNNKYHVKITRNVGNAAFPFTVWMKGAPERIMRRCDKYYHTGDVGDLDQDALEEIVTRQKELMAKGRRVLAFAKYDVPAAMVPSFPGRKKIKVERRDEAGKVVRDRKGNSIMVDQEAEIPFNVDQDIRNMPLGDDPAERAEFIAAWRAEVETAGELDADQIETMAAEMLYSTHKLTFIGMAALIDPPRPSVPEAVKSCQRAGIRVVMVTGDHPDTAAAIARMVNIFSTDDFKRIAPLEDGNDPCLISDRGVDVSASKSIVVPGWEISPDTTDAKWSFIFSHDEVVFARTSPAQKLQIVQRFQQMELDIVAVTGDGVNDAPALKKADIGVAMNIAGTEVSKAAADMILMDDNFASIVNGVEEGRLIFDNLKKSIAYTLSSNIPEIAPFLVFITVGTPLPLSTILILCIDLGTDMVPAISMAWENAEADIMRRPARDAKVDRLVTKRLVCFAYLQIGVIQAISGFFTWLVVLNDYGYPPSVLPGLGLWDNWGKQVLFCKTTLGSYYRLTNGVAESVAANSDTAANHFANGYVFWEAGSDGEVVDCTFAAKNFRGTNTSPAGFDSEDASTYSTFTNGEPVATLNSYTAMINDGYYPFQPWRAVESPFWDNRWLRWDIKEAGIPGSGGNVDPLLFFTVQNPGLWALDAAADPATSSDADGSTVALDAMASLSSSTVNVANNTIVASGGSSVNLALASRAEFDGLGTSGAFVQPPAGSCYDIQGATLASCPSSDTAPTTTSAFITHDADGTIRINAASRQMQKETLHHAQCAYFVSIVVVQWADLMICKTRWVSIYDQRMVNPAMNFGLLFETLLAAVLCYVPGIGTGLGTRDLRFLHWMPAVPFSIVIFLYDEVRKYLMRAGSTEQAQGSQIIMAYNWIARHTYY